MNSRWHEQNPMPKGATLAQRVAWHLEHRKQCACRPMPKSVVEALKAKKPRHTAKPR